MKQKIKTLPDLSEASTSHKEAIELGDDHFRAWEYNVADHFKSKTVEEIRQHLKYTAFPYAVCMENWINDFNFSSLVRNANAFNAKEVYYIGNKKVDRRGMLGCHNYTDVKFIESIDNLIKLKEQYEFVGVDNIDGAIPISSYSYKENSLLIFGSEGTGLTPYMRNLCDKLIYIEQFGSVRSLNAATASGIIMNDYVTKYVP